MTATDEVTNTIQPEDGIPPDIQPIFSHCINSLNSGDELALLVAYSSQHLDTVLTRSERMRIYRAQKQLQVWEILHHALDTNDDFTICRWYAPELFEGSHLIPGEACERLRLALAREQEILSLRGAYEAQDAQSVIRIIQNNLLQDSNLLTKDDQRILDWARAETNPEIRTNSTAEDQFNISQDLDQLEPAAEPDQSGDAIYDVPDDRQMLVNLGYRLRVEDALREQNIIQLHYLIQPDFLQFYQSLPENLHNQVNTLLSSQG